MAEPIDYLSLPLREWLEHTAAKSPTPGGGSISAVVGTHATALGRMVLAYTIGKPKYAEHESRLREIDAELAGDLEEFQRLVTEDIKAYERLRVANKSDDTEEKARAAAAALAVPMEVVVLAGAVCARLDEVKTWVNSYLYGDLRTAAILAEATAHAASAIARVNLPGLEDRREADRLEERIDLLLGRAARHRSNVVYHQPA